MGSGSDTAVKAAGRVCQRCHTRKKRCDKASPSCGRCQRLSLHCSYEAPAPKTKWKVVFPKSPTQKDSPGVAALPTPSSSVHSAGDGKTSAESAVSAEIMRVLQNLGEFADKLSDRFFSLEHTWLPFISRDSFNRQLVKYPDHDETDFDLLLLTMCLIARRPDSVLPGAISHRDLYRSIKGLVAQLLTDNRFSLNMVKSLILLALFEYSCQNNDQSFITLTTAIRLAYLLKLHKAGEVASEDADNVWWMLVICERVLVTETSLASQPLLTQYPGEDRKLPEEVAPPGSARRSAVGIMSFAKPMGFGRAAQAAGLLDRVLNLIRFQLITEESMSELAALDLDLQTFLSMVFEQYTRPLTGFCCCIATALKALFVLHSAVVFHGSSAAITEDFVNSSKAVLSAAANMMVDIAAIHSDHGQYEMVFPMSIYTIRTSKAIIKERLSSPDDQASMAALKTLDASFDKLVARWTL